MSAEPTESDDESLKATFSKVVSELVTRFGADETRSLFNSYVGISTDELEQLAADDRMKKAYQAFLDAIKGKDASN